MTVQTTAYPILANEQERLASLQSYHILDTAEEQDFDDLTTLASAICQTPIALISLVDKDRQWFKSHHGLSARETPRDFSFCAHAIARPEELLIVTDANEDDRFVNNPLVTGDPHIVFYAGVPLVSSDGFSLGSLCVIDQQRRELNLEQIQALKVIARQVIDKLELRKKIREVEQAKSQIEQLFAEQETVKIQLRESNRSLAVTLKAQENSYNEIASSMESLRQSNHELEEMQQKLKQAIETGNMDTWSIDLRTMDVYMSDFIKDLFGFPVGQQVPMEAILAAVRPDYREMLVSVFKNAIEKQLASDTEYPITNQLTKEQIWVKATGKVFCDANGVPVEYSGLFMDITERKLDELRKNDFIGMVSHELKTPLTSLNGYIQLLASKALKKGDAFAALALDKSALQVKKMTSMINGFLNVSRLQSGKIVLQKQSFRLDELIASTLEDINVTDKAHQLINLPSPAITVVADLDKIGNVLSNLISNAIKYSAIGTDITISAELVGQTVRVSIKDQGMGIQPDDLEHLFERYYRVENKNTELISGFGIGLYLCAEIIHIHQGKIWAESEPGIGSTFYFSLPLGT
jgi:signal transduction histidine kinase